MIMRESQTPSHRFPLCCVDCGLEVKAVSRWHRVESVSRSGVLYLPGLCAASPPTYRQKTGSSWTIGQGLGTGKTCAERRAAPGAIRSTSGCGTTEPHESRKARRYDDVSSCYVCKQAGVPYGAPACLGGTTDRGAASPQ